jgi:hypothetical protein
LDCNKKSEPPYFATTPMEDFSFIVQKLLAFQIETSLCLAMNATLLNCCCNIFIFNIGFSIGIKLKHSFIKNPRKALTIFWSTKFKVRNETCGI